jgi:hypothetical protein
MNDSTHASDRTFFGPLLNAVRQNPVPSVLIGAGCVLLLADRMRLSRRAAPRIRRQITRQARSVLNERPLVCAAAGAAFGAAVAAILPASRTEDGLLGPTGDALKRKLAGLVDTEYQSAKSEAARAAQQLMWTAAREALAYAAAASSGAGDARDKSRQST